MRISDWSSDVCSSDLCVELGVDVVDHGDEIDDEIIEKMVEAGTFWVPSLVYVWSLLELGMGKRFGASPEIYEHVRKMLPRAQEAGVRILLGDDYSGVFRDLIADDPLDHQVGNYGRELGFYSDVEGLSPAEILSRSEEPTSELQSLMR